MLMEVNLRFDLRFFFLGIRIFFVYMDGHPQAMVVLFPCSRRVLRRLLWNHQFVFLLNGV